MIKSLPTLRRRGQLVGDALRLRTLNITLRTRGLRRGQAVPGIFP